MLFKNKDTTHSYLMNLYVFYYVETTRCFHCIDIFKSLLLNLYLFFVIVFDVLNNIKQVFVFKFVLFVFVKIYVCHV